MQACNSDACRQGKAKCPTPEACELPVQFADDEPMPASFAFVLWAIGCIVVVALASFVAGHV